MLQKLEETTETTGSAAWLINADKVVDVDSNGNNVYCCPKCEGTDILFWFGFCPNCGVEINVTRG